MTSDAQARAELLEGYTALFGSRPNLATAQAAQSVARGESGYGDSWAIVQPDCAGSLNLGAIHAGNPPCDPFRSCPGFDTNEKGERYDTCFKIYENREEAWRDFLRVLFVGGAKGGRFDRRPVHAAAKRGDLDGMALAMRRSWYHGSDPEMYARMLDRHAAALTKNLKEPRAFRRGGVSRGTGLVGGLVVMGAAGGLLFLALRTRGKGAPRAA